jgi:hypothetical protein
MDSSRQILDKWQHMLTIVSQHSTATPDLARQFQKIFIYRLLAENILVFLLQYSGLMLSHPIPRHYGWRRVPRAGLFFYAVIVFCPGFLREVFWLM